MFFHLDGDTRPLVETWQEPLHQRSDPEGEGETSGAEYELQTIVTLHEAFPISVNDIQMAWSDEGYAKLQVEIRYRYATEFNKNFGSQADFNNTKNVKDYNRLVKDVPGAFGL